jgi:hypothetical protein
MNDIDILIKQLKESYKSNEVKEFALVDEWLKRNRENKIDSTGFCYISCQIIYFKTGGNRKWKIRQIHKNKWIYGTHYYLEDRESGKILDITSDQYTKLEIEIPYELSRGASFRFGITKKAKALADYLHINFDETVNINIPTNIVR